MGRRKRVVREAGHGAAVPAADILIPSPFSVLSSLVIGMFDNLYFLLL